MPSTPHPSDLGAFTTINGGRGWAVGVFLTPYSLLLPFAARLQ